MDKHTSDCDLYKEGDRVCTCGLWESEEEEPFEFDVADIRQVTSYARSAMAQLEYNTDPYSLEDILNANPTDIGSVIREFEGAQEDILAALETLHQMEGELPWATLNDHSLSQH
jgi:hypothetical protein